MNCVRSTSFTALLLTLFFLPLLADAQEMILTDKGWSSAPEIIQPTFQLTNKSGVVVDTVNLPFFDDFSTDSLFPDARKWYTLTPGHDPFISQTKAVQPPSKGVLTFDGAGGFQQIYDCDDRATGFTDSIVSLPIDLTGLSSSSDVYLSFQYQAGGLADNPESSDSLLLYLKSFKEAIIVQDTTLLFDTIFVPRDTIQVTDIVTVVDISGGDTLIYEDTILFEVIFPEYTRIDTTEEICVNDVYIHEWVKVWAVSGGGLDTAAFYTVNLKIENVDSLEYFYDAFQFKIAAYGNLNGTFDNWHVDYVFMDAARSPSDTVFADASILFQTQSLLLNGFSAIPLEHIRNHASYANHMDVARMQLRNRGTSNEARTLAFEISDPIGNNFAPQTNTQNVSIPAGGALSVTSAGFTNQTFTTYGEYQLTASLDAGDPQTQNDTIVCHYPIDSVLAYDDGQAEAAYGLASTRGYAMRFVLDEPDTLTGAWIQFVPSVHYNSTTSQITCLDGYGFRLNVWDHNPFTNKPDTLLRQQLANMTVDYGTGPGQFTRYAFNDTLIVADTFYVGLSQVDDKPIGLGLDLTFDNTSRFFFQDGGGQWGNSGIGGTLMIRPEFGRFIDPFATGIEEKTGPVASQLSIIPNPSHGQAVTLNISGAQQLREGQIEVIDLQGRSLFKTNHPEIGLPYQVQFSSPLPSGFVFAESRWQNHSW